MTRPIQSRTPAMSDQHSERFDFSRASLRSARMLVARLGCAVAGGRGKRRTSEEVEWSEAIEGRCENVEEVDRRCEYVDEVEGRW